MFCYNSVSSITKKLYIYTKIYKVNNNKHRKNMEEFALCWNNFQDNIASGFQSLFDRGDLVDVTIAVENRLIQAHKIVLAICSPYFQEMFQQNPCKHPISK